MQLDKPNTLKIKQWLTENNIAPTSDPNVAFRCYKDISYFGKITESMSVSDRIIIAKRQIDFIHKSMITILYEGNGKSAKGLREGFVYAISNPAWNDYIKVGCAVDVYDRLASYQTSSPHRDYTLIDYVYSNDRLSLEAHIHRQFESKGEWVRASVKAIKDFLKNFRIYPEDVILKFCLFEAVKVFLSTADTSEPSRDTFRRVLRYFSTYFSKFLNIESSEFVKHVSCSKSFVSYDNDLWLVGYPIKYSTLTNEVILDYCIPNLTQKRRPKALKRTMQHINTRNSKASAKELKITSSVPVKMQTPKRKSVPAIANCVVTVKKKKTLEIN